MYKICECGKVCETKQSYCSHHGKCKVAHPGIINKSNWWTNRETSWNKGLTQKTDERIKELSKSISRSIRKAYQEGKLTGRGSTLEKEIERRKKISETCKKNGKTGGIRVGAGHGRKGRYKGIYCDSIYELVWVIYNIDHNISFRRNNNYYKYIGLDNKEHKYYPDFISNDEYFEIKGYRRPETDLKLESVKDRKINLIMGSDMNYMFNYVMNKYNKTYNELNSLYD